MNKFYLTTPLYYPNARLHAGHAYTTLVCDALTRYKRLCGFDIAFLTGTDEHGEKLERAAVAAGVSPQAFVAEKREQIRGLWKLLDIQYSHFIWTDRPDHVTSVQRLLRRAQEAGYIYKGHYAGRYCVHCELYISEGSEPANCPVCGRPGELISESNYFFRLSAFQERLLRLYEEHPEFVQPHFRRNEVISFVKSGLRDISISRQRLKWGVPWPGDPEQVFYVWYDALTGYLTGIGFGEGENGSEEFHHYWPVDLHMVGKDILRFHAVYWPAFLMAAEMSVPGAVVAHGWLMVGKDKMSKSKGNAVYVEPVCRFFESATDGVVAGSDVLRYHVLRDIPFGQDGTISYEGLLQRYNSDLANDLGNLANRTVAMINRYFDGELPQPSDGPGPPEQIISGTAVANAHFYCKHFNNCEFSRALDLVWSLISEVNKYLVETEPWALAEAGLEANRLRLAVILYTAAEAVRFSSVLLCPVLPHAAGRLWRLLGCEGNVADQRVDQLQWGGLKPGTKVGKPELIFPRLDKDEAVERLVALETAEQGEPAKEDLRKVEIQPSPTTEDKTADLASAPQPTVTADSKISIEDFAKVDMCVGEVLSAEPIPGAKKLFKLRVDIGNEVRQVVAGIAEYYQPDHLVGMKVVLVVNLQPRKLRGVESNGMIVAASIGEEGRPVLVTFKEDVPNGARLK